jgi:hypothetical protein
MNKSIILALAAAGTLLGAGAAHAGNVQWSVGINLPVPGIVLTGGPVYQQPSYGYRAEPVYYAPAPAYYAPEPVYYPRHPQWRHHYRSVPVPVVSVPRYQPGWQPVVYPRHGDRRWEHRRDHREERREDRREDRHDRRD